MSTVSAPGAAPVDGIGDLGPGRELRSAGDLTVHGAVDRARVQAGGSLTVTGRAGGATLVSGGDMSLERAHSCALTSAGALHLLGSGASDCDIDVGGDLVAVALGATIRSGHVRIGGRLEARELAGREGAWLRLVMCDAGPRPDLLRADVVHAGVEIVTCGELLRFDRRHTDVRIAVVGGRAVLHTS